MKIRPLKVEKYEHTLSTLLENWQTGIVLPMDSWFIKTTAYRIELWKLNKTINLKPESNRNRSVLGNWLENLVIGTWSRSDSGELHFLSGEEMVWGEMYRSIADWEAEIKRTRFPRGLWKSLPYEGKRNWICTAHFVDEVILVFPDKGEKNVPWARSNRCLVWTRERCHMLVALPIENEGDFKANYPSRLTLPKGWIRPRGWFFNFACNFSDAFW